MGVRKIIGAALIILGIITIVISLGIAVSGYALRFLLLVGPIGFLLLWGIFWGPGLIVFGILLRRRREDIVFFGG